MVFVQKQPFFSPFFLGNIGKENVFYDILQRKNSFLGYRNKKFKKSNNCHFSKGVNQWFWSKKWPFFQTFFQAKQVRKMFFTIFYNEKTLFYAIKTKNSKSRIIDIFPQGLTNGFGPKMAFFPNFFFRQNRLGKCFLRYFTTKKLLSRL